MSTNTQELCFPVGIGGLFSQVVILFMISQAGMPGKEYDLDGHGLFIPDSPFGYIVSSTTGNEIRPVCRSNVICEIFGQPSC